MVMVIYYIYAHKSYEQAKIGPMNHEKGGDCTVMVASFVFTNLPFYDYSLVVITTPYSF